MLKFGVKYWNSFPAMMGQVIGKTVFFPINSIAGHFWKNMTFVLSP